MIPGQVAVAACCAAGMAVFAVAAFRRSDTFVGILSAVAAAFFLACLVLVLFGGVGFPPVRL